jgi:diguanylate cyclase (GGDEF)-like protein
MEKVSLVRRRKKRSLKTDMETHRDRDSQILEEHTQEQESFETTFYIDETDLKQIYLLKGVEPESIIGLLDLCTILKLESQEILISPSQANRTIYFVLSGRLRVHYDSIDTKPLGIVGPGESIGEMSLVDYTPASIFVVADEACTILSMDENILWSLVQSSHTAACNLLFALVDKLRNADAIISGCSELRQQYEQYGSLDVLSGLHNRRWLENMLKRQCLRSSKSKKFLSLIMIGVDHFNEFINRYGHFHGYRVLCSVASTITELLRPTEIIARYGTDEFVVVFPDLDIGITGIIAERLHKGLMHSAPIILNGKSVVHPTVSIGIAEMAADQTSEMLIDAVNRALCKAKEKGGNCISD